MLRCNADLFGSYPVIGFGLTLVGIKVDMAPASGLFQAALPRQISIKG
jgi:hypothetical protein